MFIMTLGLLVIFIIYDWNINHKLSHIFEIFFKGLFCYQWFCILLWTNEYMNSNSAQTMIWNKFAPRCDGRWVQVCIHQFQSNQTIHMGKNEGCSLGGVGGQKKAFDFQQSQQSPFKLGHRLWRCSCFFVTCDLLFFLHLHHHGSELHQRSMD